MQSKIAKQTGDRNHGYSFKPAAVK